MVAEHSVATMRDQPRTGSAASRATGELEQRNQTNGRQHAARFERTLAHHVQLWCLRLSRPLTVRGCDQSLSVTTVVSHRV